MGQAIAVRRDYTSGKLRRLAQRTKNAAQTCRLLAIAAVFDGASREEAAKIGGMDWRNGSPNRLVASLSAGDGQLLWRSCKEILL
jgi:hypothetical protein